MKRKQWLYFDVKGDNWWMRFERFLRLGHLLPVGFVLEFETEDLDDEEQMTVQEVVLCVSPKQAEQVTVRLKTVDAWQPPDETRQHYEQLGFRLVASDLDVAATHQQFLARLRASDVANCASPITHPGRGL